MIRNQLAAMADSAGLRDVSISPAVLEPLSRDIKHIENLIARQNEKVMRNQTTHREIVPAQHHHHHSTESVDFGSVVADQIRNQRSKLRDLEDECTLKDSKINQLHSHIENTKILHQKELDNQELEFLGEMKRMREIVRKLRQISPRVRHHNRRLPEIEELSSKRNGSLGNKVFRSSSKNSWNDHQRGISSNFTTNKTETFKSSRSRDRV